MEIDQWLKVGGDYDQGVQLLEDHGGSPVLIMMLRTGFSSFNQEKLRAALASLQATRVQPKSSEKLIQEAAGKPEAPHPKQSLTLTKIDQINDELKLLYKQQADAHSRLKSMHELGYDQKGLRAQCFHILDIGKEIRALILVLRSIEQTGQIPSSVLALDELSASDQWKRLTNNRSYISKFSEDPDKQEKVEMRIMENLQLERILNVNQI